MAETFDDMPIQVDPPAPAGDASALTADLEKANRKIADYQSVVADFDNMRKRLYAESERTRKYASEGLSRDLLAALDTLDRAVEAATKAGEQGGLVAGVKATAALFLDVFKRHGVTRIDVAPGSAFDPTRHEAVMQTPHATIAPGAVVQVLSQGYVLHDRVLRPASVAVAAEG